MLVLCLRCPVNGDAEVQCQRGMRSKWHGHRLSTGKRSYSKSRSCSRRDVKGDVSLGWRGQRHLRNASDGHQDGLGDRIRRGRCLPMPQDELGCQRRQGGNPSVTGGTKGAEGATGGAKAETPSVTRVRRGSLTNWAIADQEHVRIGQRQGKRG